jgi:hypothetical protein
MPGSALLPYCVGFDFYISIIIVVPATTNRAQRETSDDFRS